MTHKMLIAIAVLTAVSLACGVGNLPEVPTAGPMTVEDIRVPAPATGDARLSISFGAGELKLAPGTEALVAGTASYNLETLKPRVTVEGETVEIKQDDFLTLVEPRGVKNNWDLRLGPSPMDLTINAGAYTGDFELGGLSLTGLTVKDGASTVALAFSKPNLSSMQVFRYETGASTVYMTDLANANFSTMLMSGGAGTYTLDFAGDLKRDATITITTGLSTITLVIPKGIPASVTTETGLSNINAASSWKQSGNRYVQTGSGPGLTFIIKGGLGNLTLTD